MAVLNKLLIDAGFKIERAYFVESHIPGLRSIERLVPEIFSAAQKKNCHSSPKTRPIIAVLHEPTTYNPHEMIETKPVNNNRLYRYIYLYQSKLPIPALRLCL